MSSQRSIVRSSTTPPPRSEPKSKATFKDPRRRFDDCFEYKSSPLKNQSSPQRNVSARTPIDFDDNDEDQDEEEERPMSRHKDKRRRVVESDSDE